MNEKEHPNGERRDSEVVELSPPLGGGAAPGLSGPEARPRQAEASEHSSSQPVSRETVDLIEIMDRSLPKAPDPPEGDTEAETPPQGETTPPQEEKAPPSPPGKNKPSSFYVYLVILFGAAFLMLLLAYFVQRRNNETAMTDLRNTMNLSREQLLEKNEELEQEIQWRIEESQSLKDRFSQVQALNEQYEQEIYDANTKQIITQVHRERAELLFYLERFLENKDYAMAAVATIMRGEWLFQDLSVNGEYVPINQTQMAQYNACRKLLEDEGYIRPLDSDVRPDAYTFTDEYELEENPDMSALNVIWEELYTYYVQDGYFSAARLMIDNQDEGYVEKASPYTAGLYEQLIQDMADMGYLSIQEDGRLAEGDALYPVVTSK